MSTGVVAIVCSRDRADKLTRCLDAFDRSGELEAVDELVVIDNASTDAARALMSDAARRFGRKVRIVREPRAGLGWARNRGIEATTAAVVAFTDDDCEVRPGWAEGLSRPFADATIGFVAGRVVLGDPFDAPYGIVTSEDARVFPPRSFLPAGVVLGASLAFRRAALARIGGFDVRFGAGTPYRCEDVDACARTLFAGWSGRYEPAPVAAHWHGRNRHASAVLKEHDDFARGAYYAKQLLARRGSVALGWARARREERDVHAFGRELRGAGSFVRRVLEGGRHAG